MKTHLKNTIAKQLDLDQVAQQTFIKHQQAIHGKVKPIVNTRRKSQVKIVPNNKVALNTQPQKQMQKLFNGLLRNSFNYQTTIDNKNIYYDQDKKIMKDKIKKNKYQKYQQSQHQRQLKSMKNRVKNCKSLAQRKKDNTDPITNPSYFMRQKQQAEKVGLTKYRDKVLGKNKTQSALGVSNDYDNRSYQYQLGEQSAKQFKEQQRQAYGSANIPDYSKKRPQSAKPPKPNTSKEGTNAYRSTDLPQCSFKAILDHIVDNKLYRDTDLKVLYVRLCHKYGQQRMQELWQYLMDELER